MYAVWFHLAIAPGKTYTVNEMSDRKKYWLEGQYETFMRV